MLNRLRRVAFLIGAVATACGGDDGGSVADGGGTGDGGDAPSNSRWAAAAPIPGGPIQETATVALDGKVYVIGGLTSFANHSNKVWVFDTSARTWSAGPDLPQPVHHANVAVVGGTLYVLGFLGANFAASGTVWRYTPGDPGWTTRMAMPAGTQRGASIVGVVDGKVYVAGGFRSGQAVVDVSSYDPVGDAWDGAVADLPEARDHACGGVIDGKLYVAGGRQAAIGSTSPKVFELTPGGGWVEKTPMPTGRGGTACGVIGGRLVVVGGEGNPNSATGVYAENEAFTAASNTWESLEPMRTPRHGMAAAAVDGILYVPAGATQESIGAVDVHETFTP